MQPRMGFEKSLKTDQFQSITRLDRRIESWAAHPVPREPTVQRRVQRRLTIGPGGDGVGDTSVPKQPTLRVVHEVTIIDEIHRLADVDARRRTRNVTGDAFTTIENVELIETGLGLRRDCHSGNKQRHQRENPTSPSLHNSLHSPDDRMPRELQ